MRNFRHSSMLAVCALTAMTSFSLLAATDEPETVSTYSTVDEADEPETASTYSSVDEAETGGDHPLLIIAQPEEVDDGQFIELLLAPQLQRTTRRGENQANYEIDFVGLKRLYKGKPDGFFADGGIAWWWLYNENLDGPPTKQWAANAGLLWTPNDGDAPEVFHALGVLNWWQKFADGQVTLYTGKNYPGYYYAANAYVGNDRDTFMSNIISGDQVGQYFENIGFGLHLKYQPGDWQIQASITDAASESSYLDFSSLSKKQFLWAIQLGYTPRRTDGETHISIMPYMINKTATLTRERGLMLNLLHEYGTDAEFATFGRYTIRSGGEGITANDRGEELPLTSGGYIGAAWNRPFGKANQQLAAALMYGRASEYKRSLAFNNQWGVEIYWKFKPFKWLNIMPDIQIVRNKDNRTEFILGMMLNIYRYW